MSIFARCAYANGRKWLPREQKRCVSVLQTAAGHSQKNNTLPMVSQVGQPLSGQSQNPCNTQPQSSNFTAGCTRSFSIMSTHKRGYGPVNILNRNGCLGRSRFRRTGLIQCGGVINIQQRTFMGPLAKLAAQFAATAAVVFGKAFMQAFAQAQANAKNPKAAAQAMRGKTMDLSQAYEILNLDSSATKDEVNENFDKFFTANDPDNGGSFYLQSKVVYAKQTILDDMDDGMHKEREFEEDKPRS